MRHFLSNPLEVNWSSDGILTIEGTQISDSNIYVVFPQLYKLKPNYKLSGLLTLQNYIFSSGLSKLVRIAASKHLVRPQDSNLKYEKSSDDLWYYIGN